MKKLIAYSSVAHMAFVTFGLFAFNRQGIEGAMMVMLGHGLVSGALFLCVGVIYDRLHTREIDRYGGLADNMPGYALLFMVFTMASVGLPGTSNFVGEFLSLVGTYQASTWAAIVATTGIILGAAYMLYLYWRICFGTQRNADAAAMPDLRRARMVAARADRASRCSGWASIRRASSGRCATTSAALLARIERVAPAGDSHLTLGKGAAHMDHGASALMGRFAALLPELILSIGGTILMMVAAFTGRPRIGPDQLARGRAAARRDGRAGRRAVARRTRLRRARHRRPLRELRQGDHLPRRRGRDHRRPRLVRTRHRTCAEYAVLILFSAVGMGVMVSATSLITLYVGLELQSLAAYVLASYRRTDERSAEAGLKYFVLGALASGILLYGISLLYGFTGTTSFTGIAAAFGRGAPSLGLLFGLVFVLAGLAFKIERGAVPHVDAGRLRRRADAGHRLLRLGAQGRGGAAGDARLRSRRLARRPTPGGRS